MPRSRKLKDTKNKETSAKERSVLEIATEIYIIRIIQKV